MNWDLIQVLGVFIKALNESRFFLLIPQSLSTPYRARGHAL